MRIAGENLSKRYGRKTLFKSLSLVAEPGRPVCLWGRNGSGKSTLLKILAGLVRPTTGVAHFVDGDRRLLPHEAKNIFGIAAPDVPMYDELTPMENLAFLERMRGRTFDPGATRDLLERFGLAGSTDAPCGNFSSGMKQRLRLTASVLHRPAALLLDEPTSYLDSDGAARVEQYVREIIPDTILVIATNDMRERSWCAEFVELGS